MRVIISIFPSLSLQFWFHNSHQTHSLNPSHDLYQQLSSICCPHTPLPHPNRIPFSPFLSQGTASSCLHVNSSQNKIKAHRVFPYVILTWNSLPQHSSTIIQSLSPDSAAPPRPLSLSASCIDLFTAYLRAPSVYTRSLFLPQLTLEQCDSTLPFATGFKSIPRNQYRYFNTTLTGNSTTVFQKPHQAGLAVCPEMKRSMKYLLAKAGDGRVCPDQ